MTNAPDGFRWWSQPRVTWFLYLVLLVACLLSVIYYVMTERYEYRYSVVFETEENSTKVQLFRFLWREGHWSLVGEEYESQEPGLLHYIKTPNRGAYSLRDLFWRAVHAIHVSYQYESTVSFGVTETFDDQPASKVSALFDSLRLVLYGQSSPFHKGIVTSVNAPDEAIYTWSAITLLRQTNGSEIAILKLSKNRCQVCFVPNTMNRTHDFERFQKEVDLYAKDYRKLGFDRAKFNVERLSGKEICDSHAVEKNPKDRFIMCRTAIRNYLRTAHIEPMPDLLANKEVFVQGLYFDFAVTAGLIQEHEGRQTIRIEEINNRAKLACEDERVSVPSVCFELTYMYTLFIDGFSFSDEEELHFVKRLANATASWTMGLAIRHLYD